MTEIYMDETYCNRKTFRISSVIYGKEEYCSEYKKEIQQIVDDNIKIVGNDFKEFHSYNLSDKNWNSIGKVYLKVFEKLTEFVATKKLNILVYLEAEKKYLNNAKFIKEFLKKQLETNGSNFNKLFLSLDKKDYPALYHRIDQLYIYLLHREKFGSINEEFALFPDQSGKILRYDEKKFEMSGSLGISLPFEFYDIITMTANSFANWIVQSDFKGWPKNKTQKLKTFKPQKAEQDYIIQSCDIISNFFYNLIRYQVGIKQDKYKLKNDAFLKFIQFDTLKIKDTFKKVKITDAEGHEIEEVECIDNEMKVSIQI